MSYGGFTAIVEEMMRALALILTLAHFGTPTWHQHPGPVLRATRPWEQKAVFEPRVVWDRDRYRMWYSGGWDRCAMGYAESSDGIHWRKHGAPVLRDACRRSNPFKLNGRWYFYTVDHTGALTLSTTADGIHFGPRRTVLRPRGPGHWDDLRIGNVFVWHGRGGWRMFYEAQGADFAWAVGLTSGTPTRWHSAQRPLPNPLGGTYSAGWRDGGCLYFHGSVTPHSVLPTAIYERCGRETRKIVHRSQRWEVDQVADPAIVHSPDATLMFFDGDDNPHAAAAIGMARRQAL